MVGVFKDFKDFKANYKCRHGIKANLVQQQQLGLMQGRSSKPLHRLDRIFSDSVAF